MKMEQQQQQQQPHIHRAVLDGIYRLEDPFHRLHFQTRHRLCIIIGYEGPMDRQSLQHLVDYLDNHDTYEGTITELWLDGIQLPEPSDGGLKVLRTFFARSDTTLTKVTLRCVRFSKEDASRLLAAFHTNRAVTELSIHSIRNLHNADLGNSLCCILQNMPQLQLLECNGCELYDDGIRAFQPGLQTNRTLKQLVLSSCRIGDEGLRLLTDSLVENTIMEFLGISRNNSITSAGLDDITRLFASTQLKEIGFSYDGHSCCEDQDATHHFVSSLQQTNSSVEELRWTGEAFFPRKISAAMDASIMHSLTRNKQLNRVNDLFLVPRPPLPPLERRRHRHATSSMMLKISHKAIAKLAATVPDNAGASAVFKLFQVRPALLEKRIKRPPAAAAAIAAAATAGSVNDAGNDNNRRPLLPPQHRA
jgi:Leucine Rich repeat